jgi:hypothetical protein
MPGELFNKRGKNPRIGIGNIISVKEQEKYADIEAFSVHLRSAVYEMPVPQSFVPRSIY